MESKEANEYKKILDLAPSQITIIDAETYEILYANKSALEKTKDKKDSYIGVICPLSSRQVKYLK